MKYLYIIIIIFGPDQIFRNYGNISINNIPIKDIGAYYRILKSLENLSINHYTGRS